MRRPLLALLIGALMLAGGACGAPAPEPDRTGQTRMVPHAMGTTEITGTPERVVVMDTGELDSVLALGVTPVGAVRADATAGLQSYVADRTRGVELVGTVQQPNLEAIAALDPDLILSNTVRHEELYDELSRLAPTVFAADVGVAWKENFQLVGEALGRTEQVDQILAGYERKAEQVGARFGDPAQLSVSVLRFMPSGIRLYGEGSFIGTILADAGFVRPPVQQVDETFVEVSAEEIGQADGDLLFYATYGDPAETSEAQVTTGPLWQGLGAVSAGRAHQVPDDLWYLGIGPVAADLVLDDLMTHVPAS